MNKSPAAMSDGRKKRRNPRACDTCNARSVKCKPSEEDSTKCQNCHDYGDDCTFNRPMGKRGARPRHQIQQREVELIQHSREGVPWQSTVTPPSQAMVVDLTDIFFEVIYPVFPLFHRTSLLRRVSRGEYVTNRPLFASVMAMCALSSARVRDGALYTQKWDAKSLTSPKTEELFHMAAEAIPRGAALSQEFDYMRACALLSITSIQYGNPNQIHYYLSLYHSFVAVGQLNDETNWPPGLALIDLEERRRLFWSIYTLDVFSAIIWGGVLKSREASSSVCYPTGCDDDDELNGGSVKWLQGWNFITDLYRILEHTIDRLRRLRTILQRTPPVTAMFEVTPPSQSALLERIMTMYNNLPVIFKTTRPITGDLRSDLFGFQAANIAATLQLVRMVLFTTEHSTVEQKCQIASEVISCFAGVPVAYMKATSSPLLHHLAGIGTILGSAFQDGLSESSYRRVRSVLLDLANLLANLEVDLYCAAGTSDKLRSQVSRIDDYMSVQRQWEVASSTSPVDVRLPQPGISSAISDDSSPIQFPPELFDSWSGAFDFT